MASSFVLIFGFLALFLAPFLLGRLLKCTIRASYIYPFSISASYSSPSLSVSSAQLQIHFHVPRAQNPRWATLTAHDYEYKDAEHSVRIANVECTFRLFPCPWASIVLDGFRVQIFRSRTMPRWAKRISDDVISSVLVGQQMRLDDVCVGVVFGSPLDAEEEEGGELKVSVSLRNYCVRNEGGRVYTFGKVDTLLKKSWEDGRGPLGLVVEECSWVYVPQPVVDRRARTYRSTCNLVLQAISHPTLWNPLSITDLRLRHAQISVDRFRVRDADLYEQAREMVVGRKGEVLWGFVWDAVSALIAV